MAIIKKAQKGAKVSKATIEKNKKDATSGGGVNSRPIFDKKSPVTPLPERKAKNMPKAQNGKSVGNSKGYASKSSPLPNSTNKGMYEKKLDTIGKSSSKSVRQFDGSGKQMGQERLNSSKGKAMSKSFTREKTNTESRRARNSEFLESREKTGKSASKSMGTMKKGGTIKKSK